jgi:alkaline phosphatase D
MRIYGRLDWGRLARIHLLDDRQYRDVQACARPDRGGSNTVALAQCPALADPARTLLGAEQERWLADGWDLARPWNLVAQQTLMARFAWTDTAIGGGVYWTDGWDGYPRARNRLLGTVAAKKVPGVVVLGGDVHSNYVADLKADYDDRASPVIASEFCGTSITSLSLAQARVDAAREFNPHIRYGRTDQRGYVSFELDARQLRASMQVVDRPADPVSGVTTAARFVVDARRPGASAA